MARGGGKWRGVEGGRGGVSVPTAPRIISCEAGQWQTDAVKHCWASVEQLVGSCKGKKCNIVVAVVVVVCLKKGCEDFLIVYPFVVANALPRVPAKGNSRFSSLLERARDLNI